MAHYVSNKRLERSPKYKVDVMAEEIDAWRKGKDLAKRFLAKVKAIWNKVVVIFKEVFIKIKEAAKDGVVALGNVLGFEMDVSDSLRNKKLSISV